ncbi:protein of unknown function [Burkholderia multivorans]
MEKLHDQRLDYASRALQRNGYRHSRQTMRHARTLGKRTDGRFRRLELGLNAHQRFASGGFHWIWQRRTSSLFRATHRRGRNRRDDCRRCRWRTARRAETLIGSGYGAKQGERFGNEALALLVFGGAKSGAWLAHHSLDRRGYRHACLFQLRVRTAHPRPLPSTDRLGTPRYINLQVSLEKRCTGCTRATFP